MSIVSKKNASKKAGRNSRKAIAKSNDHGLQEKLDKGNRLLSKVINPEVLK